MFELAPVSLWLEDYSGLKRLFDAWRAEGVTDLRASLREMPERIAQCSQTLRLVKVNRKTLELYEAADQAALEQGLTRIFRDDMLAAHVDELVELWNGGTRFASNTVNYTLSGRRLDIQLAGTILPGYEDSWERVLVSIEDVTEREAARRRLAISEASARGLFEFSPVSLWVEDFSSVKRLLDDIRARGIEDLRVFLDVHPEFVERCLQEVRVVDVNRLTLEMYCAPDKATLLRCLPGIFRDDMRQSFKEELIDLWQGKLFYQREITNYSLDGDKLHVHLQFSVLPGFEHSWELVLVALVDITARKKAEAYLEFLGKHDVLTKLYNRSYYVDELNRLERKGPFPVTVIVLDLNGLKDANDQLGHAAGDSLLRRAGEVLTEAIDPTARAARIGGDEFAVLLPGGDERDGALMVERIHKLVEINNQFYSGQVLSLSLGVATCHVGERLEAALQRADLLMYENKRSYYSEQSGVH